MDFKKRPFLSKEEFMLIRNDATSYDAAYDKLNEVLDRVFTRALEAALLTFPEVAISLHRHAGEMEKLRKEFFDANPDMMQEFPAFKEAVAQLEEKKPATQYKDLLQEAASMVRAGKPEGGFTPKPVLSVPKPNLGSVEEVDESFTGVLKDGK